VLAGPDQFEAAELDVIVHGLYGLGARGVGGFIDRHVRPLPWLTRVAILRRLLKLNREFCLQMFLPGAPGMRISWRPPGWKKARRWIAQNG
jgi:hypothetical protein